MPPCTWNGYTHTSGKQRQEGLPYQQRAGLQARRLSLPTEGGAASKKGSSTEQNTVGSIDGRDERRMGVLFGGGCPPRDRGVGSVAWPVVQACEFMRAWLDSTGGGQSDPPVSPAAIARGAWRGVNRRGFESPDL